MVQESYMLVVTLILHRKSGFCKARIADFGRILSVYTWGDEDEPGNLDPAGSRAFRVVPGAWADGLMLPRPRARGLVLM